LSCQNIVEYCCLLVTSFLCAKFELHAHVLHLVHEDNRVNWEGCGKKGIWRKNAGDDGGRGTD